MEYELYLMHWGIKGQRWGIRKYQNADGTLTAAGKARYASGGDNPRHKPSEARKKARYEADRAALLEKGGATDLLKNRKKYNFTDAELKKATERIALKIDVDQKLKSLSEKELAKGKSWIDKAVDTATTWKSRVEKGIDIWNVAAKIHNSFVDEDDAWQKIGEKSVKEQKEARRKEKLEKAAKDAREKLIADYAKQYGDYNEVKNNINKMTLKDAKAALKRFEPEKLDPKEESKRQQLIKKYIVNYGSNKKVEGYLDKLSVKDLEELIKRNKKDDERDRNRN